MSIQGNLESDPLHQKYFHASMRLTITGACIDRVHARKILNFNHRF